MFWGDISKIEYMQYEQHHVDFGHTVKTLWLINEIGILLNDSSYVEFARPKIDAVLERAYLPDTGAWGSKPLLDGRTNGDKEWWIYAELDQAAEILSLNNPQYYKYLNTTQRFWLDKMVDKENGEIWHIVNADGESLPDLPKTHIWKNAFHSFEHALFGYMSAAHIKGEHFNLYYALSENSNIEVQPLHFHSRLIKLAPIETLGNGLIVCKAEFSDLY